MKPAPPEQAARGGGQAVTRWVVLAIPCTGMVVEKCPRGPPASPEGRSLPAHQQLQQVLGAGGPGPGLLAAPSPAAGISSRPDG